MTNKRTEFIFKDKTRYNIMKDEMTAEFIQLSVGMTDKLKPIKMGLSIWCNRKLVSSRFVRINLQKQSIIANYLEKIQFQVGYILD